MDRKGANENKFFYILGHQFWTRHRIIFSSTTKVWNEFSLGTDILQRACAYKPANDFYCFQYSYIDLRCFTQ